MAVGTCDWQRVHRAPRSELAASDCGCGYPDRAVRWNSAAMRDGRAPVDGAGFGARARVRIMRRPVEAGGTAGARGGLEAAGQQRR